MRGEFDIEGVFLSTVVATAVIAFVILWPLKKLFRRLGLYRLVWHPALFDAALFILLWAAISALHIGI
jgi:hypothetical protein